MSLSRYNNYVPTFSFWSIVINKTTYVYFPLIRYYTLICHFQLSVGEENWSVFRRYSRFRQLHQELRVDYPVVGNLEFPSKRFFGNRAESFVRLRRAQLEAYLKALFAILSNISSCPVSVVSDLPIKKPDVGRFHPFFKQGVFEYSKCNAE